MQTRPKPTEVIQAQIASFLPESGINTLTAMEVMKNLGQISAQLVNDAQSHPAYKKRDGTPDHEGHVEGRGSEATYDDFNAFLRQHSGMRYEEIAGRAELLTAYDEFLPTVDTLKEEIVCSNKKGDEHPDLLGSSGVSARAYRIHARDRDMVALLPHDILGSGYEVDTRIASAIRSKGAPHLVQLVAASYEDGVIIAELVPGDPLSHISLKKLTAITQDHVNELFDTLTEASKRLIKVDFTSTGNFIYDQTQGFGVVDLTIAEREVQLPELLVSMSDTIARIYISYQDEVRGESEYSSSITKRQFDCAVIQAKIDMQQKVLNVAIERLTGPERAIVEDYILARINKANEQMSKV